MNDNCCDNCDTLGISRGRSGPPGPSGTNGINGTNGLASLLLGSQNVFISKSGVDGTGAIGDLSKSFLTVTAAINKALSDPLLSPSSTNVVNFILYPGTYEEDIIIPAYSNLISIVPSGLIYIKNTPTTPAYSVIATKLAGALRPVYIKGTITCNSDNVNIVGVNCDSLMINSIGTNSSFSHIIVGTAIGSRTSSPIANINASWYDVHSPSFLRLTTASNVGIGGYFEKCTFLDESLKSTAVAINLSAIMVDCDGRNGCFAGSNEGTIAGNITQKLIRCSAIGTGNFSSSALSGSAYGTGGEISATLEDCEGLLDFNFSSANIGGIISGKLKNVKAGNIAFGSGAISGGTISGELDNISLSDPLSVGFYGMNATITGVLRNSRIQQTAITLQTAAIKVGANAKVEYCTLKGTTNAITTAAPISADINFCKLIPNVTGNGLHTDITNLTTTPYITDESTSIF